MAWTTPRDWTGISDDIVTAAMLNVDVRDNLTVLGAHTHTGAAGQGASSMSALTLAALVTLTFADQSANPDAAGELQRNGNDLLWYGSSVVNLTAADASAGTASLRTLGTTSVKAAAGNHSHVPGTPNQVILGPSGTLVSNDDETTLVTSTIAVQGASEAIAISGAITCTDTIVSDSGNAYSARLKYTVASSTTTISTVTISGVDGSTTGGLILPASGTAAIITPASIATYTVFITIQRTSGSEGYNPRAVLFAREVGA